MSPVTTLPERSLEAKDLDTRERDSLLSSPCTLGPAENEPDSNPRLREATRTLLEQIGEDPNRVGLWRTPHRVARAWEYLTSGYSADMEKILNGAIFQEK